MTLDRRVSRLERADDAGASLVAVVIMDGEIEADRIAEECARRGISPERASLAIVRVSRAAESIEAWVSKWTAGTPAERST